MPEAVLIARTWENVPLSPRGSQGGTQHSTVCRTGSTPKIHSAVVSPVLRLRTFALEDSSFSELHNLLRTFHFLQRNVKWARKMRL